MLLIKKKQNCFLVNNCYSQLLTQVNKYICKIKHNVNYIFDLNLTRYS